MEVGHGRLGRVGRRQVEVDQEGGELVGRVGWADDQGSEEIEPRFVGADVDLVGRQGGGEDAVFAVEAFEEAW